MTCKKNKFYCRCLRVIPLLLIAIILSVTGIASAVENEGISGITGIAFALQDNTHKIESNVTTIELTMDETLQEYISNEISSAKESFKGPGLEMISYDIEVFNLIKNSDISDPEYLERGKGITIKINYNGNEMNKLQKTLWGYEYDATEIFRIFFKSEYHKEIGFILISFEDQDSIIEDIKFKMTAKNAEKYKDILSSGIYLDRESWSSVEIFPDGQISMYEDPKTSVRTQDIVNVNNAGSSQVLTDDEDFKEYILKKDESLNLISQKIINACLDQNWNSASEFSEELMTLSSLIKNEVSRMVLSEKMNNPRENYLEYLDSYSTAAMDLWYGTSFRDDDRIKEGISILKTGLETINDVYNSMGEEPVEESRVIITSTAYLIPDTLKLDETYKYQDYNKENDISIKIEDYGYKKSIWIKDGDNSRLLTSEYGKKYFYIVIDVTHLGFRGGNTEYIYTPDNSDFTLTFRGEEISDSTPDQYIRSLGVPYSKVKLNRREHFEALMLFIVPEDFTEEEAYISVDLGNEGIATWSFEYPENSSLNP